MEPRSKLKKTDENYEIKVLLEKLTHSGEDTLNVQQLHDLKSNCSSDKTLIVVYNELMKLLQKKHAEVRLSTVQLLNELFLFNDTFRGLLSENIRELLRYTIEDSLPPPKSAAKKLLKFFITCIDNWNRKYGSSVYKINATYNYLRDYKNVDFEIKEIVDPKKRMEEKEKERKTLMLNKELLKKANSEMEEMKPEIEGTIMSLDSCFSMLLPTPEEFTNSNLETAAEDNKDFEMRLFGVIDPRHTVEITFDCNEHIEIRENEENSAILDAAKDSYTLINNRFLPKTKAWIELLRKVNDRSEKGTSIMKQALVQELKLNQLVNKYKILKIIAIKDQEDEVSSDSDLEEVALPKPDKATRQREEIGFLSDLLINKPSNDDQSKDNSLSITNDNQSSNEIVESKKQKKHGINQEFSERKKELLKVAPKLPYDIDLYHWEDEKLTTPTVVLSNCEGANFWSAGTSGEISEIPVPGGSSVLRTRVIEFSGKFEPINRACRVPLPSGKLCPRKDRVKCPFHGSIVDRDEQGHIINEEDKEKLSTMPSKPVVPDWQDPKLLADIKATTGVDLKMPEKGKRKKRVKYPGLTDINAAKVSAKARLSKKIFNKASLKRVASVMDNLDHKKHRDKFGDQFNYMHSSK